MTKTKAPKLEDLKKTYDYVSIALDSEENKKILESGECDFTDIEVVELTENVKSGKLEKYWNSKGYEFVPNDHIYLAEYGKTMEEKGLWIVAPNTAFRFEDGDPCHLCAHRGSAGKRKLGVVYERGDWDGDDGWGFLLRKSSNPKTIDTSGLSNLDQAMKIVKEAGYKVFLEK